MKVNKCECSRDDKRVIESKADIARTLKEAGMAPRMYSRLHPSGLPVRARTIPSSI